MGKLLLLIVILLIALGFVVWLFVNFLPGNEVDDNLGDEDSDKDVCGGLEEDERDLCCAEKHGDDITIQCVGGWQYLEDKEMCQFVCDVG